MADFLDDELNPFSEDNFDEYAQSDVLIEGDGGYNVIPTTSDTPEYNSSGLSGVTKILGSAAATARDVGTIVGTAQNTIKTAGQQYSLARSNAASGNKMGQFWQYASPTDKMMIVLAGVGIVIAIVQLSK